MNQQLQDWCDFCEGQKNFDKSHFYTLFHDEFDEVYLENIFKYFPKSHQLVTRTARVKKSINHRSNLNTIDSKQAFELAVSDVNCKRRACQEFGEDDLVNIIDHITPKLVDNIESFEQARLNDWPHGEFMVVLADYFSAKKIATDDRYYAIFEAFYGLTTNFHLQWYLAAPLLDTDIALNNYFELWRSGYDYALTQSQLLVYHQL